MESNGKSREELMKDLSIEICETQIENLKLEIFILDEDNAYDYPERLNRKKELKEEIEIKEIEIKLLNEGLFMSKNV